MWFRNGELNFVVPKKHFREKNFHQYGNPAFSLNCLAKQLINPTQGKCKTRIIEWINNNNSNNINFILLFLTVYK